MTRTLTTAVATAASAEVAHLCHLLSMAFAGGTAYMTTAARDIIWNSQTWSAIGGALSFEAVQETNDLSAQGVKVRLDGISTATIAAILTDDYIGREANLYLAHIAADGTIIADPILLFRGYMNEGWTIQERRDPAGGSCTIETRFVSPLVKLDQVRGIRANLTSHQSHPDRNGNDYSADTFMRHIATLRETDIGWGIGLLPPGWGSGS